MVLRAKKYKDADKLRKTRNAQLKELLTSARNYIKSWRDMYLDGNDYEDVTDFVKKIDQVLGDKTDGVR